MRYLSSVSMICCGIFAHTANAQDATCASDSWAGGDATSSDISTALTYFEVSSVAPVGEAIVSRFTVSSAANIRLEADSTTGGDTVIELFSEDGITSIGADDDSGGGYSSRLELNLEPGNYCLRTSSFQQSVLPATVRIGRTDEHEALTTGLSISEAGTCDLERAVAYSISPDADGNFAPLEISVTVADNPYVALELSESAPLLMFADGQVADSTLTVFDTEMNQIDYNDDYDGLSAALEFPDGLGAGTYCVTLGALSDETSEIKLEISKYDAAAARLRDISNGDVIPPRDGSIYTVTDLGNLNARARTQAQLNEDALWFAFDVDDATLVRIDAAGPDGSDPILTLFDEFGERVSRNDDVSPSNYSSRIYEELFPGTYFFAVTNNTNEAATLRISLRQYVPVQNK